MYLSKRNDLMTFETSIDKIKMHNSTESMYWGGFIYAYRQQNALYQQVLCFKTAEIIISLRFLHVNSVHITFEERDFCVSKMAQTRTIVQHSSEVFFGQPVYFSVVK